MWPNLNGNPGREPGVYFEEADAGTTGGAAGTAGGEGGATGDGGQGGGAGGEGPKKPEFTPEQQEFLNYADRKHRDTLKREREEKEQLLTKLSKAQGITEEQKTSYEAQLRAIRQEKELEKSRSEETYRNKLKAEEAARKAAEASLEQERKDRREADTSNLLQGLARRFGAHDHESAAVLMRRHASYEKALDPDTKAVIPNKYELVFKFNVLEKTENGEDKRVEKSFTDPEAFAKAYFGDPRNDWMVDAEILRGRGSRADGGTLRPSGYITASEIKGLIDDPEAFAKRRAEITKAIDSGRVVADR